MTRTKDEMLIALYSELKDIIACADNGDPYTRDDSQWTAELLELQNEVRLFIPRDVLAGIGEEP